MIVQPLYDVLDTIGGDEGSTRVWLDIVIKYNCSKDLIAGVQKVPEPSLNFSRKGQMRVAPSLPVAISAKTDKLLSLD